MLDGKVIAGLRVSVAGRFLYRFLPVRKRIVKQNIRLAFNHLSEKELSRLTKAFYSHLATLIKELFLISWCREDKLRAQIELRGVEHLTTAHEQGRGVIMLVGHLGNWEFGPLLGLPTIESCHGHFSMIRRSMRNKWLENMLFQRFQKAGIEVINNQQALKKLPALLVKKGIIIYTIDQHASVKSNDGIAIEFFGTKAGTYKSLAFFVHRKKLPVVPSTTYRLPNGKHVVEFFPALEWQEHADLNQAIYENTKIYNQTLETMILAHPEQWYCWLHRRWKLTHDYDRSPS